MNTNPDEVKLALWLDDELHGDELAAFEQWVVGQPNHLAAREESRAWRKLVVSAIPAVEEPPYPNFFNSRLAKAIHDLETAPKIEKSPPFFWKTWFMPIAACAGMAAAFWLGGAVNQSDVSSLVTSSVSEQKPSVYVPEKGVDADWFNSKEASATVIVLQGVSAIPDSTDFFSAAYTPKPRDRERTVSHQQQGNTKSIPQ